MCAVAASKILVNVDRADQSRRIGHRIGFVIAVRVLGVMCSRPCQPSQCLSLLGESKSISRRRQIPAAQRRGEMGMVELPCGVAVSV